MTVTIFFRLQQLFSELWAHWFARCRGGGGRRRRAGLKPGVYMGELRGRCTGLKTGHYSGRIGGRGRIAVVEILEDPFADEVAPIVGAKGVDVFVLG